MLSIGKASAGYYINLAKDDYYHRGTEPAGIWYGKGAEAFSLTGTVDRQDFLALCAGYDPHQLPEKLVQNAGRENRRAGWDMTFSAAKTVSALWATADEATRQKISACNYAAVLNVLDYAEAHLGFTRFGNTGREVEKSDKLFFSLFEHSTSRAQDPQLHVHVVMVNLGINERGETKSLEVDRVFKAKMMLGAFYRAELAYQLRQELGVELVSGQKGTFEIKGDFKGLVEEWSKRREAIEKAMKNEGAHGAARAAHFTLKTREKKDAINREDLFESWGQEARQAGFEFKSVINQKDFEIGHGRKRLSEAMPSIVSELTKSDAYFTQEGLFRKVAEFAPLCDANMKDVMEASARYLKREAIHLRTDGERKIYTTKEIDALEKQMLKTARQADQRGFNARVKDADYTLPAILNDEQRQAVFHICESEGALKLVSGMAGTGKTTLLSAANDVWRAKGFDVQGAALAAIAAKGLEEGSRIQSKTIARLLLDIERAEQTGETMPINERTVLVVDEAGMIGTRQMARLIEVAEREKAKLVLVGDEKQLQPIEHGAPFKAIGNLIGRAELKDIKRQREQWARDAVHQIVAGESEKALSAFAERGMFEIKETREEAIQELVTQWRSEREELKEKMIFSTTKSGAKALNELAQFERKESGELRGEALSVNGFSFYAGDRILFTKNHKGLGVMNGLRGTVLTVNPKSGTLGVVTDSGDRKIIATTSYENIELGYAINVHKAQGITVEKAFVLAGGSMQDRELSYTQFSRTREATRIYTSVEEGGRSIEELAQKMNQSRMKELAQEQRRDEARQAEESELQQQRRRGLSR